MSNPELNIPVRAPAETGLDDAILPFAVKALDLRGRIVRLGAAVDTILSGHGYPAPVAKLLGEAIAVVREQERASISLLQRRLRIGYLRASRLIEMMEQMGVIGPQEGPGRSREVRKPGSDGYVGEHT